MSCAIVVGKKLKPKLKPRPEKLYENNDDHFEPTCIAAI
jgi:hypothetical protein